MVLELIYEHENAFWNSVASTLLSQAFCYIPGAYRMAFKHMEKAMLLEPTDVNYKEGILFFYVIPDKLLEFEKAKIISEEILSIDPNNATAKKIINTINDKNK